MDGVMPMSFALTDVSSRQVARNVQEALLPQFTAISARLTEIAATLDVLTNSFREVMVISEVFSEFGTIREVGLRTYEINPVLLDHIQATRWATAYMSYVEMVDLIRIAGCLHGLLHRMNQILIATQQYVQLSAMGALCSCALLAAILAQLQRGVTVTLVLAGALVIQISGPGLGDFFKDFPWLKLLGLLVMIVAFVAGLALAFDLFTPIAIAAVAAVSAFLWVMKGFIDQLAGYDWGQVIRIGIMLTAIAGFVYALGLAFRMMNADVLRALGPLGEFIDKLKSLAVALAGLSAGDVIALTASLAALSGFVYALGVALRGMSADVLNALGPLGGFIDKLQSLAVALAGLSAGDVLAMTASLAALSGFVYALGAALRGMSADVLNALGPLGDFIDKLRTLAVALAGLSAGDVLALTASLTALAGFVYALGAALSTMSADVLNALGPLGDFIDKLGALAAQLAALSAGDILSMVAGLGALAGFVYVLAAALGTLSPDMLAVLPALSDFIDKLATLGTTMAAMSAGDLLSMAAGLGTLALFVYLLGAALNTISSEVLAAMPAIAMLFEALNSLATSMAGMSVGELLTMAGGFALIAAFVWALAAALNFAAGPLASLATIMENVCNVIDCVTSGLGGLLGALGDLVGGGLLEELLGGLGGLAGGGLMDMLPELLPILLATGSPGAGASPGAAAAQFAGASPLQVPTAMGAQAIDQSVQVGSISVAVNAERLEANSAQLLSDQIIARIQERLGALRSEQSFRTGDRTPA